MYQTLLGSLIVPGVARVNVPGVARVNVPGVTKVSVPDVARVNVPGVANVNIPGVARVRLTRLPGSRGFSDESFHSFIFSYLHFITQYAVHGT